MAITCIFFTDDAPQRCRVLEALRCQPAPTVLQLLEDSCCRTGQFIRCPIFQRVERGLLEARASLAQRAVLSANKRTAGSR